MAGNSHLPLLVLVLLVGACGRPPREAAVGKGAPKHEAPLTRTSVGPGEPVNESPSAPLPVTREGVAPRCNLSLHGTSVALDCAFARCPGADLGAAAAVFEASLRALDEGRYALVARRHEPPRSSRLALFAPVPGEPEVMTVQMGAITGRCRVTGEGLHGGAAEIPLAGVSVRRTYGSNSSSP